MGVKVFMGSGPIPQGFLKLHYTDDLRDCLSKIDVLAITCSIEGSPNFYTAILSEIENGIKFGNHVNIGQVVFVSGTSKQRLDFQLKFRTLMRWAERVNEGRL
jgi:hypothetical protein